MILAVGPGTPACSLITSEVLQPSSDDSENESESQEDPGNDRTHRSPFSQDSGSAHEKKRTITEGDVINSESEGAGAAAEKSELNNTVSAKVTNRESDRAGAAA